MLVLIVHVRVSCMSVPFSSIAKEHDHSPVHTAHPGSCARSRLHFRHDLAICGWHLGRDPSHSWAALPAASRDWRGGDGGEEPGSGANKIEGLKWANFKWVNIAHSRLDECLRKNNDFIQIIVDTGCRQNDTGCVVIIVHGSINPETKHDPLS